ncbi:MAG: hypothetical protein J6Y02_19135 [Pseudobutyrivibrio sp.]|nr:hypothetical protein [Pseudobutyrivibrio sp.]
MYDFPYRDHFYRDEKDEAIAIITSVYVNGEGEQEGHYEEITISSDSLIDESFEMQEAITDNSSLNFQNCISSYVQFTTKYVEKSLLGCWLNIYKLLNIPNPSTGEADWKQIPLGRFYVVEDDISYDGITQNIIAYDALYSVINLNQENVKAIYDNIYDSVYPVNIKNFRDYFFSQFSIEQDSTSLINDDIVLPRQLSDNEVISGYDIVKCIAEINGVFPHMGKDGLLHWISLDVGEIDETALYPNSNTYPSINTYPGKGYEGQYTDIYKNHYESNSCVWASYKTLKPDGVQIRNQDSTIAYFANADGSTNPYIVINNFMCYDLEPGQYQTIAERLYKQIKGIGYVPFEVHKMGDPCLEVGDRVVVHTEENILFSSYIFNKHTTEIRGSFEDIQTNGTYTLSYYDVGQSDRKLKDLDSRVGNLEKSGSGPLQILSVRELPDNPQLNILYLIQGEVVVT